MTVIARGAPLPAFDCHLPLMSVPHVLRMAEVPADDPYVAVEPELRRALVARVAGDGFRGGHRLGSGNPRAPGDRGRSIPLRESCRWRALPGVRLISLQKNDGVAHIG